jgi:protein-tyrosine phosphatase
MAAAVLANRSSEITSPKIIVSSSGTSSWHVGEGAHPLSQATWQSAGYNYDHSASQFGAQSFASLDLILAMDKSNYANILALSSDPLDHQKVVMLRHFDPAASSDEVPDPWGNEAPAYRSVLEMVESAVSGLLKTLQ